MKKQLLSITILTIVALAIVLLNPSWGETPQTYAAVDCSGDANEKKDKINREVEKQIQSEEKLRYQHNENKKNFEFEPIVNADGVATLYIWGFIHTSKKDRNKLNKTFKEVMKKTCVEKVVFTSPPDRLASAARFEFSLCEAPNKICPNGTCQQDCDRKDNNSNVTSNSNKNSNSNK